MTTLAEISVPAEAFPLGCACVEYPDVTVELERLVPTNQFAIPYCWVAGADGEAVEQVTASLCDRPDVRDATVVDEVAGEFLIRIEWHPCHQGIRSAIVDADVSFLSGVGDADGWRFEVRSVDRDGIAEFERCCRDYGIPLELISLHDLTTRKDEPEYGLTESQREALHLAFDRGYFDSPRRATLDEIGEELGITRQSLASRLRRGQRRLVANTLKNR